MRKPKGQPRIDNPDHPNTQVTLAKLNTRHMTKTQSTQHRKLKCKR